MRLGHTEIGPSLYYSATMGTGERSDRNTVTEHPHVIQPKTLTSDCLRNGKRPGEANHTSMCILRTSLPLSKIGQFSQPSEVSLKVNTQIQGRCKTYGTVQTISLLSGYSDQQHNRNSDLLCTEDKMISSLERE